jgi:hypothetical protein
VLDKILFRPRAWLMFAVFISLLTIRDLFVAADLSNLFSEAMVVGWLGALGIRLKRHLPGDSVNRFQVFQWCLVLISILGVVLHFMPDRYSLMQPTLIVLLLVLVSLFITSFIMIVASVSRWMKLLEKGDPIFFSDYLGTMILFFFFPVGIWIIQPRIRTIGSKCFPPTSDQILSMK